MLRRQIIEKKGECTMALDTERRSRSYLYGRLLAVADRAESSTYDKDSARTTNARRFFEAFSNHPYTTWAVIFKNLRPYLDHMNEGSRIYYERLINEITELFDRESFSDNSPLTPEFLHAYSCQTNALFAKKDNNKEEN
jgi:CRISPR-associated protein Csd1